MSRAGIPGRAAERGFTLLEMLVALVLMALIMTLLASGARLLRGSSDRLDARSAGLAELTLTTTLLQERLGDAVALDFGRGENPAASFDGTADQLRFVTLARAIEPSGPRLAMAVRHADARGLELVVAELGADTTSFAALEDAGRSETRRLANAIAGLAIRYFGTKRGAPAPAWHTSWQAEPHLPRAVRFDLEHQWLDLPPLVVVIRQDLATLCPTPLADAACAPP